MRVKGTVTPKQITVEPYPCISGVSEVRLRENVIEVSTEYGKEYEYDEYVLHIPTTDNLKSTIESNLKDWLATGRSLEVNENASMVQDMKQALSILGVSMNE